VQEIAFSFSNAQAYLDAAVERGVHIDAIAPTLFTFLSTNMNFLEEIAKFRAARRVWAEFIRERYKPADPRSEQLRIFVFTAGSSLTAQQPLNNVVRTTIEAVAAALGGVQTMHVCAYDEAVGVPTEKAAGLALRTQQIVALESGLPEALDPLGGAYAVEELTNQLASQIQHMMKDIDERGGAVECIDSGWFQQELAAAAYETATAIESGEKPVVGVNRFESPPEPVEVFRSDPQGESLQRESLQAVRSRRSASEVVRCLDLIESAARSNTNVIPACIDAVKAYASIGEIVDRLKNVFGSSREARVF
jgi:methylmalonyl-CoA mutase N-terminal domain/subunit